MLEEMWRPAVIPYTVLASGHSLNRRCRVGQREKCQTLRTKIRRAFPRPYFNCIHIRIEVTSVTRCRGCRESKPTSSCAGVGEPCTDRWGGGECPAINTAMTPPTVPNNSLVGRHSRSTIADGKCKNHRSEYRVIGHFAAQLYYLTICCQRRDYSL